VNLAAPPHVIRARKQELTLSQIEHELIAWSALIVPNLQTVDATRLPDDIAGEILVALTLAQAPAPVPGGAPRVAAAPEKLSADAEAVLELDRQAELALNRSDVEFLGKTVFADDLIFTHGDAWTKSNTKGNTNTKEVWLNSIKSNPGQYSKKNANLQRIEMLVKQVDKPGGGGMSTKFYQLRNGAKASDVVSKLRGILGTLQQQLGSVTTYSADDRTNQVILITDPRQFAFFDDLIEKLDTKADPNTRNDVNYLKHAKAADVVTVLTPQAERPAPKGTGRLRSV
jgi:hypothetical protein